VLDAVGADRVAPVGISAEAMTVLRVAAEQPERVTYVAFPRIKRELPELRLILVTGPRLSPDAFEPQPGLEVRPCVHNLHEHLACCDLALAQGSLSTTTELVATRRPFLSFPLQRHFEQCVHVRQRLANYAADRSMDHAATLDPEHRGERCSSPCATGRWKPRRGARRTVHRAGSGEPRVGTMTPQAVSTCRFDARR